MIWALVVLRPKLYIRLTTTVAHVVCLLANKVEIQRFRDYPFYFLRTIKNITNRYRFAAASARQVDTLMRTIPRLQVSLIPASARRHAQMA